MIALTSIANDIETKLNNLLANTDNRSFKIFADLGDFQKTYKAYNSNEITRYINGVLEAQTPSASEWTAFPSDRRCMISTRQPRGSQSVPA